MIERPCEPKTLTTIGDILRKNIQVVTVDAQGKWRAVICTSNYIKRQIRIPIHCEITRYEICLFTGCGDDTKQRSEFGDHISRWVHINKGDAYVVFKGWRHRPKRQATLFRVWPFGSGLRWRRLMFDQNWKALACFPLDCAAKNLEPLLQSSMKNMDRPSERTKYFRVNGRSDLLAQGILRRNGRSGHNFE